MVMRGIDISNWQHDIDMGKVKGDIDFCIVKATEGLGYVDPACDRHVQQCKGNGLLWGFYHFARENDAKREAQYFYENCKNYFGEGIPVLDYETHNYDDVNWCETFCNTLHELSGVWPIVYMSASYIPVFSTSWLPEKCGLWVAGYPYAANTWTSDEMPYNVSPWKFAAIWQFTSSLRLTGYNGNLDGNIAYMDAAAWAKYANANQDKQHKNPDKALINEILSGKWGTGETRLKKLDAAGYDGQAVQDEINRLYAIAQEVVHGKWGNGWNRKQALEGAGYDYDQIQSIVNVIMGE